LYLGVSDNLFFWFGTSAFHVGGALFWLLIMWYWKNQFNEQVELKCFLLVKDIKKLKYKE
jgi:membrane protein implicated in regulation of membrane protease activity